MNKVKKITAFLLVLALILTIGFPAASVYASDPVFDDSLAATPTGVVGRVLTPDKTGDKVDWIEIARNGKYSLIIRKEFLTIYPNKIMGGKDISRDYKWQFSNGYSKYGDTTYNQSVVRTYINRWFNGENYSDLLVGEHDRLPVNARLRAFTMMTQPAVTYGTSTTLASLENGYSRPSKYQVGVGDDVAFTLSFGEAANFLSKCSYHRDYYEMIGGVKTYVATKPSSDIAIANYNRMVFPTMTDARCGIWLRSQGDISNTMATLDAAPPAPLQGGEPIGRVFQEYFNSTTFRGYVYPACWVDQEIFTDSTKAPPAPVTVVPTGVDGRILTPEMTGDRCDWIEIATCGDASLIVRQKFVNPYYNRSDGLNDDTGWQCMGFGMPQRSLNPPPLNPNYFESYPQYFTNVWFGGIPWFIIYGTGGYALGESTERLPMNARLREYTLQNTMKYNMGTCAAVASLTNGFSRPTFYKAGVGTDVAFALSYGEAANFISKTYFQRGPVANQESSLIAKANYAKLYTADHVPEKGDGHRWGMWLRSTGDIKNTMGNLDFAPSKPLESNVGVGRAFQEYYDTPLKNFRGEAYPALWVDQGIFITAVGHTVKGQVWPMASEDIWNIGDSFMKAHDVVVELRSTFNTPAPASLSVTAVLKDDTGLGEFTFTEVPDGDYVLYISRPGYLTRSMKVTVDGPVGSTINLVPPGTAENGIFKLWWGDCTDDLRVDNDDILMILELIDNNVNAFSPLYNAACDMNADGLIDNEDILMVLENWNKFARMYPGAGDVNFYE